MTDTPVRFGLVGLGAWGQCHAKAIESVEDAHLVAVADSSDEAREIARREHPHAEAVADYRELVERGDVDVVDIVVPSHRHHEVAAAALLGGKHVLLEKPMALSVADCNDLVRLAAEHDRLLAVGHEFRLSSLWGKVRELIGDGVVGKPQYVLVELLRNPYRLGTKGWRYDIDRVGNWILEEPIHFFDLARWYLESEGAPQQIYAVANSRQPDHPELQDNFSAIMTFAGGAYAVISQTLSAFEHHQTVKIAGTQGALWAGWSGAMDRVRQATFFLKSFDGETLRDVPVESMAGELFELEEEIRMMVNAVRSGAPPATTGADGMWSVAMCEAATRSVEVRQPVLLDSVLE